MKILIFLLVPFALFGQMYEPDMQTPFMATDTLYRGADTVTSSWCYVGKLEGAAALGLLFDPLGDSTCDFGLQARLRMSGFTEGGGFLDSLTANTDALQWLSIGTIDSSIIKDSVSVYIPLSKYDWWNFIDYIQFRLISSAFHDRTVIKRAKLRGR
jgi:hypothetical protein